MNIQKQVVSLEIAKRLKELGVKQESYFTWVETNPPTLWQQDSMDDSYLCEDTPFYSAFNVAELGEMLPIRVYSGKRKKQPYRFYCNWDRKEGVSHQENGDTEADARGKMLIYLLENKIINL